MHAAMKLVLFDLDHTLLDGDSNHLWIEYLMAAGLAGPDAMQRQVDDHARYLAGQLDIDTWQGRNQVSLRVADMADAEKIM